MGSRDTPLIAAARKAVHELHGHVVVGHLIAAELFNIVVAALQAVQTVDRGTPHKCPICDGTGVDPRPAMGTILPTCPTCCGERVLWSNTFPAQEEQDG